jgi:hypothetical protein
MATTTRRSPALLWLLLALAVLLVSLPPLCRHAVESHGRTAYSAKRWVEMWEPEPGDDEDAYFRGVQEDGRPVHILRLPRIPGTPVTWAVVVVGASGLCCVTAFLSQSRERVERKKAECKQPEWERR